MISDEVWEGLSGSLRADIAHTRNSAIASFPLLQCGRVRRDIKMENYDHYSEVVHSLRKDRKKPELVEYLFWWHLLGQPNGKKEA